MTESESTTAAEGPQPIRIILVDDHAVVRRGLRSFFELVDDIERLDAQRKASKSHIRTAVKASATTLTDIFGVGDVVAATLIGHAGDPHRFINEDRFAAYNGTAPIDWSSGNPKRPKHRLPRDQPCAAHHRRHPDPLRAQSRPRLLRPQTHRRPYPQRSDPRAETTDQQHRLPTPHLRRETRVTHTMTGPEGNRDTTPQACVAGHCPDSTGTSATATPEPNNTLRPTPRPVDGPVTRARTRP